MADIKLVMSWLEGLAEDESMMFHSFSQVGNIARSALALLKEQETLEMRLQHACECYEELEKECNREKERKSVIVCPHCGRRVV